jgi:uncharacterized protein
MMPLTGTLVNFGAIIAGGALGLIFKKGLKQKYMNAILYAIALVIFALGISYVLKSQQILVVLISLILGTLLGTLLKLNERLQNLGVLMQNNLKFGDGRFSDGFTTCTLLYCVGAMAITGSIQGGLEGDHTIIYLKSVMDGVTAIFFASTLGVGVLFSALPVLIYQGAIALAASLLAPVLDMAVITEMAAAGGVALMALSLNMMEVKKLNVADMLPAIFFPIAILPLVNLLTGLFR